MHKDKDFSVEMCMCVHLCSECELVYMPIKYLLMVVTLHNWVNAEKTVRLNFHAMQCICANEVSRSEAQQPVCRGPDLCEALSEV